MPEHVYGWRGPSLPDHRNLPADTEGLPILEEVDPRDKMPEPYDQGQLGSCTGNAYAGAVEFDAIQSDEHFGTPSRLAIYYGERLREGTVQSDAGAVCHDAFKDGRRYGVGPETLWPYEIAKFRECPSQEYLDSRPNHRVRDYRHPAQTEEAIKRVLSNGQTVVFGFSVYESFESEEVARTGVMPVPQRGEELLGGHAVLAVGYLRDRPGYFLIRNSWGPGWGEGGYFHMPAAVLLNPGMASDFRTIHRPAGA